MKTRTRDLLEYLRALYLHVLLPILLLPSLLHYSQSSPDSHALQISEGRAQYEMVTRESTRPRYGACWTEALSQLETGCKTLDDEVQGRLALAFANCFLAKAGQQTYPCPRGYSLSSCLEDVDNNAFNAYSNFFTHTQNMCYFLQSQVWQDNTELAMEGLTANSVKVSKSLEESHTLQRQLVDRQQQSLEYQRQLAENGTFLASAIEASKGNVKEMLEEFKTSTFEQKTLIFEVFDRVSRLQNLVVSEVSWLYTVIFYSACLLVIYLVTATKRTGDARLWMFVILTVNFAVERLVVKWSLPPGGGGETQVMNLSQVINDRVWFVRQVSISIAILTLSVIAYKFKDYNKINNRLLEEIKRQNLELRSSMESFQVGGKPSMNAISTGLTAPLMNPSYQDSLSTHLKSLLAEDTGFAGDEEDFSDNEDNSDDDDDDDVFNTTNRTDVTYRPGSPDNSIYDEDFATGPNSRETTPVKEIDTAMTALSSCLVTSTGSPTKVHDLLLRTPQKSLRCSTPIKELKTLVTPKRLSTPRSCADDLNSSASRYNLRRTPVRAGIQSAAAVSSVLEQESPEVFARVVKKQQQVTRRNAAKWNQALRNHQGADFSSDEQ